MIPPAALAAIEAAAATWLADPDDSPLTAAVTAALDGWDVTPTDDTDPPDTDTTETQ